MKGKTVKETSTIMVEPMTVVNQRNGTLFKPNTLV